MLPSRRALLGLGVGLAGSALAGCGVPALPAFPGAAAPKHKVRVAGLYGSQLFGSSNERLSVLLQQAVDHMADAGDKTIDTRLDWLSVPPPTPGSAGQPSVPGEVQALDLALDGTGTGTAAAVPPDLVALGNPYVLQQVAAKNLLRPIDDLLRSTSTVQASDYFAGALDAGRVAGKLYRLPLSVMPAMLQYDSTLFEAAGLDAPGPTWDWNRFLDACLKLTKPPTQYAFLPFSPPSLVVLLWQNGADLLSKDGRQSTLDTPEAIEAAGFYADLFRKHQVVTPQAQKNSGFTISNSQITYNGARIAMQFTSFPNMPSDGGRRAWRIAEVFRGRAQATTMPLQSLLAMTSRKADPPATFTGMAALAEQVQKNGYLPPRRSLLKTAEPLKAGYALDADEAAAIARAAEYARAAISDQEVNSAFFGKLQQPLQTSTQSAAEHCKAAAAAIDDLLQKRASGGAQAAPTPGG